MMRLRYFIINIIKKATTYASGLRHKIVSLFAGLFCLLLKDVRSHAVEVNAICMNICSSVVMNGLFWLNKWNTSNGRSIVDLNL